MTDRYALFPKFCVTQKLPKPEAEVRFHPTRKHRLDFAWPSQKLGLEIEGGVWTKGRHGRGSGIIKDLEKHTLLAEEGWRLIRVTPSGLYASETVKAIKNALRWRTTENE